MNGVATMISPIAMSLVLRQDRVQGRRATLRSGARGFLVSVQSTSEEPKLETLVLRIATHRDESAFAALFVRIAPRVKGLMLRLRVDAATADELAQETMLRVWQKSSLFDPSKASAATWIFAIARNLRVDWIRRENRPELDLNDPSLVPPPEPSAEEHIDAHKRQKTVRACLADLPDDQRQAVHLSFIEGLSHQEIADRLDIPLGTVKSRLRLSFDKLRTLLRSL